MADRSSEGRKEWAASPSAGELPPPEIAEFIRFAHRRRRAGWPEIYDDMCGVAARREFRGWDYARLAELGVTFSLFDTPRLAAWVRAILPREGPRPTPSTWPATDRVAVGPGDSTESQPPRERSAAAG